MSRRRRYRAVVGIDIVVYVNGQFRYVQAAIPR